MSRVCDSGQLEICYSLFVLAGRLIWVPSSASRKEPDFSFSWQERALTHSNPHHLLTTTTDHTKNRKHPSGPTSLPAWPVFPLQCLKLLKKKFKWNTRKEQSKDIHYLKIIQTVSSPRCPPNTFRRPIPVARTPNNSPGEAGERSCTEPIRPRPKTSNGTTNAQVINNASGDDQSLLFPTSEAKSMKWHR